MSYFKKNMEKYSYLKQYLPKILPKLPQLDFSGETWMKPPNFTYHQAVYIAVDILDSARINEMISSISKQSIIILWYLDATSLQFALEMVDFLQFDELPLILCGHPSNKKHLKITEHYLSEYAYYMTNIRVLLKASDNIDFIKNCKELLQYINKYANGVKWSVGNSMDDVLIGVRNKLINYPYVLKSAFLKEFLDAAKPIYKGKPAVIVASGPSLDKNIHLLKKYQNKAILLSCDGSLRALYRQGITPDMVGTVERGRIIYEKFFENKPIENQVFIGPALVDETVAKAFDGRQIICYKAEDTYANFMSSMTDHKVGVMRGGISVAHLMYHLAVALECEPIILMGQDLAYSKDGMTHTSDAEVLQKKDPTKITEMVEGIDGEMLPTTEVLKQFLYYFEEEFAKTDKLIIDATEGGARIAGTKVMPLKDVFEERSDIEKVDILALVKSLIKSEDEVKVYQANGVDKTLSIMQKFTDFQVNLLEAKKQNARALKMVNVGIDSQVKLNIVYDAIDYMIDHVIEELQKDEELTLRLFQYRFRVMHSQLSKLNTDGFSIDTIKQNLIIHQTFLDQAIIYNLKAIRVFVEAIQVMTDAFELDDMDLSLIDDYKFVLEDDILKLRTDI